MTDQAHGPSIPTVDLAALAHHERPVREHATASIREGFSVCGVVYLENHGVDFALRDRLLSRFVELTERPSKDKEGLERADLWFQRGYGPPNDRGECFVAAPRGIEPALKTQYPELCADNVWPDGIEGFSEDCVSLGQQLHEAGLSVLQGVAMSLGMAERTFDRRLEGAPHLLRLLRQTAGWSEVSTGWSLLTLRPDGGSGMSVRARTGDEIRVEAPEACIVAQVGQQLEILTGGELLATPHTIAAPEVPGDPRVSGAHLLHLHCHQVVFPLELFRTDETIRVYSPPVLAGTYVTKTLVDLGLAPSSALDELGYRHYRPVHTRAGEAGGG